MFPSLCAVEFEILKVNDHFKVPRPSSNLFDILDFCSTILCHYTICRKERPSLHVLHILQDIVTYVISM